jgi:hypothetical protein
MAAPASATGQNALALLASNARRLATEIEQLHSDFDRTGALVAIRRFMELHSEGNPEFDMLLTAKHLRSWGALAATAIRRMRELDTQALSEKISKGNLRLPGE